MQETDLEKLIALAISAGKIALSLQGKAPKYWYKPTDNSRVSEADIAVNDHIVTGLANLFPDAEILSEEDFHPNARFKGDKLFVLDPIDGTEAYLNGQPYYCVSIGYLEAGVPQMGVIYAPALDDLFYARKTQGAFRNGKPITISTHSDRCKILATNARYNRPLIAKLEKAELKTRPSTAYRLALTAAGEFDATFGIRPNWDWDIVAGDLICREAGGKVVTKSGAPIYNQSPPQQSALVAGRPDLVEKIEAILKELS